MLINSKSLAGNSGLRLKMTKIHFGPFGENFNLVPELWKNYSLVPGVKLEILDRIEDELWTKFQYSCEFKRSSI